MNKKKYKIVEVHKDDAFYVYFEPVIGKIGVFYEDEGEENIFEGFQTGTFHADGDAWNDPYYFLGVKLEEIKDA
jgi:hypothetical protein